MSLQSRLRLELYRAKSSPARVIGFSLVELLVVMAIIVVLSGSLYAFYAGKGGSKPGDPKTPMSVTHDSECLQNMRSVRQVIEAYHTGDSDTKFPGALTEMKELTSDLRACPVGKEPYSYDPTTGEVHCVHPGHEKY